MKIAWFTPFSQKSAIGKYSKIIVEALDKQGFHVDIWLTEKAQEISTDCRKMHYESSDRYLEKRLMDYDICIYNLGDSYINHHQIYEVSRRVRGIVILHDFVMHHFFASYFIHNKYHVETYVEKIVAQYGEKYRKKARQSITDDNPLWSQDNVSKFPFFEEAVRSSYGVIVHSNFLKEKVEKVYKGPITKINLPFVFKKVQKQPGNSKSKIILSTIGHINENKQIHRVLESLGSNKNLKHRSRYYIAGPPENKEYYNYLVSLINKYKLTDTVTLTGYLSESKLDEILADTDIFVNLRNPAMEGASWSLIEEMSFGKPVIVANTGFYQEIPDYAVMKIQLNNFQENLTSSLMQLVTRKDLREKIGREAEKNVAKHNTVEEYINKNIAFCDLVAKQKPFLKLVDSFSYELSQITSSNLVAPINEASEALGIFNSPVGF